ncbi:hypothetical protein [Amycolatopsis sp. NPDC051372]|uniref:hypothetical protein n=1 Tax=Amycolatopsis sp. NPDC051372 TaxID=3155669 RepID=UPI003438A065
MSFALNGITLGGKAGAVLLGAGFGWADEPWPAAPARVCATSASAVPAADAAGPFWTVT